MSRFPLQLRARITGLAGFSLQSLTRVPGQPDLRFNTHFNSARYLALRPLEQHEQYIGESG